MNVKQAIQALQTMIDTGAISGEEEFGVYEYSPRKEAISILLTNLKHSPKKTLKKPLYISKSFIFQLSP